SIESLAHATRTTATKEVCRVRTANRSAVVKTVSSQASAAWQGTGSASDPRFWSREPELYRRGLPACFIDAGVTMPRLLGCFERPGVVALWMQDVQGTTGSA